ncbi:MAG: hypothetical protein P4M09_25890 [Devosia sp.]|nr:hypothetical protein [Devosia sp.]
MAATRTDTDHRITIAFTDSKRATYIVRPAFEQTESRKGFRISISETDRVVFEVCEEVTSPDFASVSFSRIGHQHETMAEAVNAMRDYAGALGTFGEGIEE